MTVIPPDIAARVREYLFVAIRHLKYLEMGVDEPHATNAQAEVVDALNTAQDIIRHNTAR